MKMEYRNLNDYVNKTLIDSDVVELITVNKKVFEMYYTVLSQNYHVQKIETLNISTLQQNYKLKIKKFED